MQAPAEAGRRQGAPRRGLLVFKSGSPPCSGWRLILQMERVENPGPDSMQQSAFPWLAPPELMSTPAQQWLLQALGVQIRARRAPIYGVPWAVWDSSTGTAYAGSQSIVQVLFTHPH